jgi:hypothetical protein
MPILPAMKNESVVQLDLNGIVPTTDGKGHIFVPDNIAKSRIRLTAYNLTTYLPKKSTLITLLFYTLNKLN